MRKTARIHPDGEKSCIEDIIAGDGSGQDVYNMEQDNPIETFDEDIMKNIHFVEQFFEGYLCR